MAVSTAGCRAGEFPIHLHLDLPAPRPGDEPRRRAEEAPGLSDGREREGRLARRLSGAARLPDRSMGLAIGAPVRIIRDPYFGVLGTVSALPSEPQVLESGSRARVLEVTFAAGERVMIPRANVERIEA